MEKDSVGRGSDIHILYEDDEVVVINKPAGILVHEDGHSPHEGTVVEWLLGRVPRVRKVGEVTTSPQGKVLERSGVVHRLDRDTSGVLVLAKTANAHLHLKLQFHDRLVKKEYRALVYGKLNDKWGTINKAIGRSASDFRLRSATPGARGTLRVAITHYECISTGEYQGESFSYLKLKPKTGRTHQLRVHLKAINRPIVGDQLYALKNCQESNNLGLTRMALHAYTLELLLPNGKLRRFMAPIPVVLEQAAKYIAD